MHLPKCEFCLTQGMLPVRKLEPGCVFCMTLWREVRPEESCWDCASNEEAEVSEGQRPDRSSESCRSEPRASDVDRIPNCHLACAI